MTDSREKRSEILETNRKAVADAQAKVNKPLEEAGLEEDSQ